MGRKAIVSIIVGERYQHLWRTHARASWERYAARHGYSLIVLDQPVDPSPLATQRSISWQKLLVLGLPQVRQFEQVVWIDSDVLINDATAPCILTGLPVDKIGAVRDQFILSDPAMAGAFSKNNDWPGTPAQLARVQYQVNGLAPGFDYWLNCGILVLSPAHHRDLLEHVYHHHRDTPVSYYEQIGLSHEILLRGLHHAIDPRFNSLWLEYKVATYPFLVVLPELTPLCLAAAMDNSFFLHFARWPDDLAAWDPNVKTSRETVFVPTYQMERIVAAMATTIQRVTKADGTTPLK